MEPKSVRTGGDAALGETQIPEDILMSSLSEKAKEKLTFCVICPAVFFPFA